jgi:hypothetical protein
MQGKVVAVCLCNSHWRMVADLRKNSTSANTKTNLLGKKPPFIVWRNKFKSFAKNRVKWFFYGEKR